jgi:uncharacterized membrane protein YozB (DUF420 family)
MKLKSAILAQLNAPGFLGTGATLAADFNLSVQLLMGIALLLGMILARHRHYRAHAICQGSVVLLNLVMIGSIMLPPFARYIVPGLPQQLSQLYYFFPTLHAIVGTTAQLLGLYILIRTTTCWLPQKLCFRNYKLWMRTELALWWIVILLGITTYYIWL